MHVFVNLCSSVRLTHQYMTLANGRYRRKADADDRMESSGISIDLYRTHELSSIANGISKALELTKKLDCH